MIVIGGGVIGVELASVYNRLGSQVTVIEMLDHICPALDQYVSKQLHQILKKQGIEFLLSSLVVTAVIQPDEVILTVDRNGELQNLSAKVVLVSVGRRPHTEGLGLERVGIQQDKRGFISVDEHFRTSQSHIFAIGDVIEGLMLAHRASAEGVAVIESLKGERPVLDYLSIPNVIYTYPEVASVGLTELEAQQAGLDLMVGMSFFRGNPRARCNSETEGFVKVIGAKHSGRLVGIHILGPHASELIAEGMIAMQKHLTVKDIGEAAQAHPTLSEAIKEAALDALGRPIHH
jgi:dihydrolipoamide dehydrogenase